MRRLIITLAGITESGVTAITVNTATGDEGKADVTSTLDGIAPTFSNGIHSIRAIAKPSSTSITFAVIDYTINDVTFSGGTAIIKNPALADTSVNEIYGSCIFSDPNASSESYIILVANNKAVAVKISDPSTTFDLAYTGTENVSSPVEMIQAFNKVYIFREGDAALFVDLSTNNITGSPTMQLVEEGAFSLPSAQATTAFEITKGEAKGTKSGHGYVSGDVIQVKDVGASGLTLNDTFTVSRVSGNDFSFS